MSTETEKTANTKTVFSVEKNVAAQLRLMAAVEGVKLPALIERMITSHIATYPEHIKLTLSQLRDA